MNKISRYIGAPGLREARDIMIDLAEQLTHPSTDLGWRVFCGGCEVFINIDFENKAIIFDDAPLFEEGLALDPPNEDL